MRINIVAVLVMVLAGCGGDDVRSTGATTWDLGANVDVDMDVDGGSGGLAFPLTLTPLTRASTSTANISLFFSVTDANGLGVVGLTKDDFTPPLEDGVEVDPLESAFSVSPLEGSALDVPTVLVLDLSGSVIGSLPQIRDSANAIIDNMLPEQRMAIMTFADKPTLRAPFTTDKMQLHAIIDGITKGDGVSTDLYGAVVQAVSLWKDGFNGDPTMTKLTAGIAIVLTDGRDDAGLSTLQDVIEARGNQRVVTVGVGDQQNLDFTAMQTIGNAAFINEPSYAQLVTDIGRVTTKIQMLSKSIYSANYCSPKRAGMHTLTFTVVGNPLTDVTATCAPATFPSNAPSACGMLSDPSYTEACKVENSQVTCCPFDLPFWCESTAQCYATAAAAQADCGTSCLLCGGDGTGAGQDTQLTAGPAIHVDFTANSYQTTQCPAFWGANCTALQECCKTVVPVSQQTSCVSSLNQAQGDESSCMTYTTQYCPVLGASCSALKECCTTYSGSIQTTCQSDLASSSANEAQCKSYEDRFCPTGTNCSALKNCCATFNPGQSTQASCYSQLTNANGNELTCTTRLATYCPSGANCSKLKQCCATQSGTTRDQCEQAVVSANGNESTCTTALSTYSCN